MSMELILVGCNSITSTAEDIFRETELRGLDQEAHEVVQNMVDSLGIEQREVAATKEDKQYVLQGQLLVLGDARTGKTSTVKALTGQEFKDDENETKGVEFKYVNQEWKTLDLQDMQYGNSVLRFVENVEIEMASWPPTHDQRRITIRNDYKSLVGNFCRGVIEAILFLWHCGESKFIAWFMIFRIILLQMISKSSFLNFFSADFLIKGLFYGILYYRLFYVAANRRTLLGYLIVFFLLHCVYFLTANFSTGDYQIQMESLSESSNETIFFGKIFLYPFMTSFILPSFFLIIVCTSLLISGGNVFHNLLIEMQYILIPLFFLHGIKNLPLDILITLSTILTTIRFGFVGSTCFLPYFTPLTNGCLIFTLHLFLLYQQKILLKWYTGAALALEFAVILQMYLFVLDSKMQLTLFYVILLCVGAALHIYGRWLEVNAAAEVRITAFRRITDFRRDPTVCTIAIFKFSPNMQKLKANFSKLKIKILDFAGDEEYYAYHQIFLNSNAIYAVVFNIQECIKDNFKEIESKVRSLRFWLESIHSHVPQGRPIFLVGTHRGDIKIDTLREINTHINDAVGHLFIDEIVLNEKDDLMFFHVENSRGLNDNGVISLRRKISSVAEEELKDVIGQEIPCSWTRVQDAIIRYQENHERPVCFTVQDFKERCDHLYMTWSEKMLNYLHNKGFIIHADKSEGLSKWVLLNPNVLVQIVILLISQPEELTKKRGLSKHWVVLKKSGMLTKDLLEFIISHATGDQATEESALITFMEEYDLVCPLKDPFCDMQHLPDIKQTTHFVPSLLPAAPAQAMWLESSEDAKFYIFFDSFVPEAFFFRLLSRSCKASYHGMESYVPEIYRDCGVFFYSQQIYRLHLMKDEGLIEVTLTKPMGFLKPFDILLAIAIRVEDIRYRDFQNVFFHCGPACSSPTCPGSRTDSMSLLTDRPRRHVHNVYPACKQKGPKCFNDFFKCQNVFRVEDAEIWKPPPSNRGPMEALR